MKVKIGYPFTLGIVRTYIIISDSEVHVVVRNLLGLCVCVCALSTD